METEGLISETVDIFIETYGKILERAVEVLTLLNAVDPQRYKVIPIDVITEIDHDYIRLSGEESYGGCTNYHETYFPTHYLYDEAWLAKVRAQKFAHDEQLRLQQEAEEKQRIARKLEQDRQTYERLKHQFEGTLTP